MSLQRFVLKRGLITIPLLLGISLLTFGMVHAIPGDPIDFITLFTELDPQTEMEIRAEYGLDQPVYIQYIDWVTDAATGDFGRSIITRDPVINEIMDTTATPRSTRPAACSRCSGSRSRTSCSACCCC